MSSTPTVLIIEDDPVFRRVLSFTVAKTGLAVETANDGEIGFARLMQGGIDFIVTDHQMPMCGGVELLQRLKDIPDYQRPPAILCTAKGLELDSEKLRNDFNLAGIMHKPFSPRKLSEVIIEYLESTNPENDVADSDSAHSVAPDTTAPTTLPLASDLGASDLGASDLGASDLGAATPPQGCGDG